MADQTQLTEALATIEGYQPIDVTHEVALSVVRDAARLLLDFPNDEMVEAAERAYYSTQEAGFVAALEAVRRVMFGG